MTEAEWTRLRQDYKLVQLPHWADFNSTTKTRMANVTREVFLAQLAQDLMTADTEVANTPWWTVAQLCWKDHEVLIFKPDNDPQKMA